MKLYLYSILMLQLLDPGQSMAPCKMPVAKDPGKPDRSTDFQNSTAKKATGGKAKAKAAGLGKPNKSVGQGRHDDRSSGSAMKHTSSSGKPTSALRRAGSRSRPDSKESASIDLNGA